MFCYIFDKATESWVESNNLFPHDVALLIHVEEKKVYFYCGPKSTQEECKLGKKLASEMMDKYKTYEMLVLEDIIPLKIQSEIDLLMGDNLDASRVKITRSLAMIISLYGAGVVLLVSLIFFINHLRMLGWSHTILSYSISPVNFDKFFKTSSAIVLVLWILALVLTCITIFGTKRIFLVVSSSVSAVVGFCLWIYIQQGIYLFNFTLQDPYAISRMHLYVHLFWIFLGWIGIITPLIFSSYQILTKTEIPPKKEINMEELRLKSRPSILRDNAEVEMQEILDESNKESKKSTKKSKKSTKKSKKSTKKSKINI
ncbi:MAG: hypothetical protein ACTSVU_08500 [Promethearchaeota archaeon]